MAAGNRSSLGFGPILCFHLSVLLGGVLLQNAAERNNQVFLLVLGAGIGLGVSVGFLYRRFLWDVFRTFKSAATLITLLVLSCVLGTFIIQDLDLRRNGVFDPGLAPEGELPPFDNNNQATRFMLAESHGWLWLFPNEERERMTTEKVVLSPVQKAQVELRKKAFGKKQANTYKNGVLASKRRQVNDLTTSQFARQHRQGLYDFYLWTRRLHLFDIFEAWWFYMLLGLIAINVIVGTFARAPWSRRDFGIVITHSGLMIILTGALLDRLVAKEGYIHYVYGEPDKEIASKMRDDKNRVFHNLPFRVLLERFATEYYHELLVRRFDWSKRADGSPWKLGNGNAHGTPFSAVENYPIREGVPLTYEDGKITVIVHKYKPRVFVETEVEDVAGGRLNPGIELGVYRSPTPGGRNLLYSGNRPSWLFANDEQRSGLSLEDFRFEYVWADSLAEYDRLVETAPLPDNGTLVVRLGGQQVRVAVTLGGTERVQIGGQMLELEFSTIRSALADASNVNLDRRLQRSEEPVLWLRVNGKRVFVPRDDSQFMRDFDLLKGVEFRFDWPDPKDRGVYNIYRVIEAEDRPRVLVQADYGGTVKATRLRPRIPVGLVGRLKDYYFGVTRHVRSGRVKPSIREMDDDDFLAKGGGDEDHLLAAWADVEIKGAWGSVRKELTPHDPEIAYGKDEQGRPLFWFSLFRTNAQLDWFSVLTVIDHKGNKVKSHAVQVNSPLRHDGYRFFQATAATRPDGLSVSGISVTYNPGVNFMYVGFYVLVLGVCHIFLLRKVIDRDRRAGGVLLNFGGRVDRSTFWRSGMILILAIDIAAITLCVLLGGGGVLWFFMLFWWIPTLWPRLALHVKRCHDVNRSGWFLLIPLWPMFEAWALGSFPRDNKYGSPLGLQGVQKV